MSEARAVRSHRYGPGLLNNRVACFESASGLIRPVPAGGYWPLSIPLLTPWSLLILGVAQFGADRDVQFWNYPLQGLLVHEDGITS